MEKEEQLPYAQFKLLKIMLNLHTRKFEVFTSFVMFIIKLLFFYRRSDGTEFYPKYCSGMAKEEKLPYAQFKLLEIMFNLHT